MSALAHRLDTTQREQNKNSFIVRVRKGKGGSNKATPIKTAKHYIPTINHPSYWSSASLQAHKRQKKAEDRLKIEYFHEDLIF